MSKRPVSTQLDNSSNKKLKSTSTDVTVPKKAIGEDFNTFKEMVEKKQWRQIMNSFDRFNVPNEKLYIITNILLLSNTPKYFIDYFINSLTKNQHIVDSVIKTHNIDIIKRVFKNQQICDIARKPHVLTYILINDTPPDILQALLDSIKFTNDQLKLGTQLSIAKCKCRTIRLMIRKCTTIQYLSDPSLKIICGEDVHNIYDLLNSNVHLNDVDKNTIKQLIENKLLRGLKFIFPTIPKEKVSEICKLVQSKL